MKHIMTPAYKPKLDRVFSGEITQVIMRGSEYEVGDDLLIHDWEAMPYRSPWRRVLRATVTDATTINILPGGILYVGREEETFTGWDSPEMDEIARKDGIDPPTGRELEKAIKGYYGDERFYPYQIITWIPASNNLKEE